MFGIFSFFSGAGFLDLGFEKNNFKSLFVNEPHTPFLETYKYSREKLKIKPPAYGYSTDSIELFLSEKKDDFLQTFEEAKKNCDMVGFIGGPPCPDFSVAGKNEGQNGKNGKLSKVYIDLICMAKPDFFLFENVKGLWKNKKHRAHYEELKEQLWESGYVLTEQLVNSIEFGVPQDRFRILLFGVKKELVSKNNILQNRNITEESFDWYRNSEHKYKELFSLNWPTENEFSEDSKLEKPLNIPLELTIDYWFNKNNVENHPNAKHHFIPRGGLKKFQSIPEGDTKKKSYKRLHRWRYSPTAAYGNNEVHLHPFKARRISVSEALAIQSLPKEYILPDTISLTNMFKTVGNGVPFRLSSCIAETISLFLEEQHEINSNKLGQ